MATKTKKRKHYKSPKSILRHTLDYFKANPNNWTTGTLRRKCAQADDGVALCALGGCLYFAEEQKFGNTAIRYLAEAMGMNNAHTANLASVKKYVYLRNDNLGGRKRVLDGLKKAVA